VLFAMNEPSLRKFIASVEPGGWVLYNGPILPDGIAREDVHFIVQPFAMLADSIGAARAANMVMLGAMVEATGVLERQFVDTALHRLVKSGRWLELDEKALACGREAVAGERNLV